MRIAILGATSEIAKDLILAFDKEKQHSLVLFARRPADVQNWMANEMSGSQYECFNFDSFNKQCKYDAIINFVGVGNPAKTAALGAGIFDITLKFDELALQYIEKHPNCKYVFLSSGAAYCSDFLEPANEHTKATIDLNHLKPQDWYGVAKLHAECRHRALPHLYIVDVRVFNYFSHTQDMNARFLVTDILRAIQNKTLFETTSNNIVRDYIHPSDFHQLINLILSENKLNIALDCYSKAPIDKLSLLFEINKIHGLRYEINHEDSGLNITGNKPKYYSINRNNANYLPKLTSLECVLKELAIIFD